MFISALRAILFSSPSLSSQDALEAVFANDVIFCDSVAVAKQILATAEVDEDVVASWDPPRLFISFKFDAAGDTDWLPPLLLDVTMPPKYPREACVQVFVSFSPSTSSVHASLSSLSSPYARALDRLSTELRRHAEELLGEVAVLQLTERLRERMCLFERDQLAAIEVIAPTSTETKQTTSSLKRETTEAAPRAHHVADYLNGATVPMGEGKNHDSDLRCADEAPSSSDLGTRHTHIKLGLVGMPNVGKSSLFNLLSGLSVPAMNYPFCTIDPHQAVIEVADPRLTKLASLTQVPF
jgi:hypothetical protein